MEAGFFYALFSVVCHPRYAVFRVVDVAVPSAFLREALGRLRVGPEHAEAG